MGLHKLTAGDGYTYLTRQVAAFDATERGYVGLGDYYSQRGESPGLWAGSGLIGLVGIDAGQPVSEKQMKALFGEGRHPDAVRLEHEALTVGHTPEQAKAAASLGRPFLVFAPQPDGFRARCSRAFADFNATHDRPSGTPVPAEDRARIRSELGQAMFADAFGRPARDARELSGFVARSSRPATTAVAGYDLTFSPVKSVSALWALAPREVAEQIEAAHHAAVADTLSWLERHACFTRTGHAGIRQVETTGLIAAVFAHRDSRAGDPDLHSHVAISNKVQTRDGRWLALDGRVLHKAAVAASERYNTRLEAELVAGLGVRFAPRPRGTAGKRPVREIVGMDERLLAAWSSRRAAIDDRRGGLAADFQRQHGRPPTTVEAIALAQQATLETRGPKHEPRSLGQQREAWRREAIVVLGQHGVTRMLAAISAGSPRTSPWITEDWVHAAAIQVLNTVGAQRSVWQCWHVRAEAERVVRAAALAPADVDTAVTRVTEHALSPALSIPLGEPDPVAEPPELRRSDGASVYTVAGARLFTSQAVLDAEALLISAAGRDDGVRAGPAVVGLALLESMANGLELNPGQAQLVRELACSGSRLQLAIAPAGAGKTTALTALARAWAAGGGSVVGLAPSAIATTGLREALGVHCDTLSKLCCALTADNAPAWVAGIGPRTLVIVDEAGMAGTIELAQAVGYVLGRGGSVRLVGDNRQLASVAAGGVLRDIAETFGAVTLSQLVRFDDPAEAAATVALRDGDTAALGFYLDRDRIHVGDPSTCAEAAYTAWAADCDHGVDAVLLAGTRELVLELNRRARADRLAGVTGRPGPEVTLADGTRASAGDRLISRRNDRTLTITTSDWVKNGDRWTVRAVRHDGGLDVIHEGTGRRVTLPASYVREHVELGYATTVHGAQGITAETCHTVLTGTETRQLLYVALSRGRAANHLYLATVGDGEPHSVITPAAIRPPTATDLLAGILARDGEQTSAGSTRRALDDPAERLRQAVERYTDGLRFAAELRLGTAGLAELEDAADRLRPGLAAAPAWPTLRAHLALRRLAGEDPLAALQNATAARELTTAADPAAVLDWRLDDGGGDPGRGPLPWLPAVPAVLDDDPAWGSYLAARAAQISAHASRVAAACSTRTGGTSRTLFSLLEEPQHARLRAELAVWRAATGMTGDERRPTGPPRLPATERRYQRRLDAEINAVVGPAAGTTGCWAAVADGIDPRIRRDEHWPTLADRLATAGRAGLDAAGLLAAVAAQRPLPDDLPAAALWWRLAPHLAPATVVGPTGPAVPSPRPAWCPALFALLPEEYTQRVLTDPAWPALVAAVSVGARTGWEPAALVTAAAGGLPALGNGRAGDGLVEALVFRVAALTDPAPVDRPEPLPADLLPPDDLHLLPDLSSTIASTDAAPVHVVDADPPVGPDDDPEPPLGEPTRYFTPDPFTLRRQEPEDDGHLLEQHFWATAAVGRDRLIELNEQADAFFTDRYLASWAARYLEDRVSSDPAADPRFSPGHAPAGWTVLTSHLRSLGASDEEVLAAGLGVRARTGAVIDRFRDRLTFPIRDLDGVIRGFIARRNPAADGSDRAGPKYLNTATTDLFTKGDQLFGLFENREALAAGAAPAIVEGPLDALALTLAGDGAVVGVAMLGTALTDRQADQLRPYIRSGRPGIVVATDADDAGQQAAERMYWPLTARGDDPRRLLLPAGLDPADVLHVGGAPALRAAIGQATGLVDQLLDACIDRARDAGPDADPADAVLMAAAIIGALPPARWLTHIERVTDALGVPPGSVHMAVADAGHAWRPDPIGRTEPGSRCSGFRGSASVAPPNEPPTRLASTPMTASPPPEPFTAIR